MGPAVSVLCSGGPGHRRYQIRRWDLEGTLDEAAAGGHFRHDDSESSLDLLLRTTLSLVLPTLGGALLHASSAVLGGRGFLFPGPSGAGKSTLVRTSKGDAVLADELSIVRRTDGRFSVFSSPLHYPDRVTRLSCVAPLAAIAFPDRSLPRGVHRLGRAETLARLLRTVICFCKDDPALDRDLLSVAEALTLSVPALALSLPGDRPVWDPLLAVLDR